MRWDSGIFNGHGDGRGLRVLHLIVTSWHVKMVKYGQLSSMVVWVNGHL
jgi:hypothetical protein